MRPRNIHKLSDIDMNEAHLVMEENYRRAAGEKIDKNEAKKSTMAMGNDIVLREHFSETTRSHVNKASGTPCIQYTL